MYLHSSVEAETKVSKFNTGGKVYIPIKKIKGKSAISQIHFNTESLHIINIFQMKRNVKTKPVNMTNKIGC